MNQTPQAVGTEGFERSVAEALAALRDLEEAVRRTRAERHCPEHELDLLRLETTALLTRHQGLHLIGPDTGLPASPHGEDQVARLVVAHHRLVDHTTAATTFAGLEFVNDIGALCREVGRHGIGD